MGLGAGVLPGSSSKSVMTLLLLDGRQMLYHENHRGSHTSGSDAESSKAAGVMGSTGDSVVKTDCSAGDTGSTPGSGRFLGEGNGNQLQYSCLENSMDGGA